MVPYYVPLYMQTSACQARKAAVEKFSAGTVVLNSAKDKVAEIRGEHDPPEPAPVLELVLVFP